MRVRYDRRHLASTGPAAQRLAAADGHDRYIYATAYGYTIQLDPAPFGQSCIIVRSDGSHDEIEGQKR